MHAKMGGHRCLKIISKVRAAIYTVDKIYRKGVLHLAGKVKQSVSKSSIGFMFVDCFTAM